MSTDHAPDCYWPADHVGACPSDPGLHLGPSPMCVIQVSSYLDDDDRSTCGSPADVEVFATSGEWEPWCELHAHSVPAYRVREIGERSTPEVTHLYGAGGWRACDTHADWYGSDTTGVTCPECLEATR